MTLWDVPLSVPAENFKGTWHLAWFSSCQYLSFLPFLSLFPSLFTSHSERILRQAVWCSKQKGLKAFPPNHPDSRFPSPSKKNRNWLEKMYSRRTQTRADFPFGCCKLTARNMFSELLGWRRFLRGGWGRLIVTYNLSFPSLQPQS